jgi:hypothetical protein
MPALDAGIGAYDTRVRQEVPVGRMISVRVSERTRREVGRLARASGRTESAVVREAIEEYVGRTPAPGPYEALRDVIGMVEGGPTDLSEKTGEKFRALLLARRAARP